jgi:hypothetical protein
MAVITAGIVAADEIRRLLPQVVQPGVWCRGPFRVPAKCLPNRSVLIGEADPNRFHASIIEA